MLHEPAVALTDFGVAVEGIVLAWMLARSRSGSDRPTSARRRQNVARSRVRFWFVHFFISVAIAAALGGIVHGFVPDDSTRTYDMLWQATLLSIGYTALTAVMAGAHLLGSSVVRNLAQVFAVAGLAIYAVVVIFFSQEFRNAIFAYVPCAVFLLVAFRVLWSRSRARGARAGIAGVVLTFVAAAVQQSSLAAPALYLDHNAIYHIMQAIAFVLIFVAARAMGRDMDETRRAEAQAAS